MLRAVARHVLPWLLLLVPIAGARGAVAAGDLRTRTLQEEAWEVERKETFRMVWSTVNDSYFDETFGGINWRAVGERYRDRLPEITEPLALRQFLHAMLQELGQSHFAIVPREAVVFQPAERDRLGHTGLEIEWIEGQVVVTQVRAGSAAERGGIRPGTVLRRVGEVDLGALAGSMTQAGMSTRQVEWHLVNLVRSQLTAVTGTARSLEGDAPGGQALSVNLTAEPHAGAWSEPLGHFPSLPLELATQREDDGSALLRFSSFAPALMKPIRTFLRSLQPGDTLVIDLRGNPGGVIDMACGIAGLLVGRETLLGTVRLRKGMMQYVAYPQERAFHGPIAVLVDAQSASTSEILAAGLRDHGRVRLFGETTAGAALPSAFKALPNGDLLQYATGDVRRPGGATIEGTGVTPDVVLHRSRADVEAGRDAPLAAARAWLVTQRGQSSGSDAVSGSTRSG